MYRSNRSFDVQAQTNSSIKLAPVKVPHSNAFLDLSGDFTAGTQCLLIPLHYILLCMIQFAAYRCYVITGSYTDIIFLHWAGTYQLYKLLSSRYLGQPDKFE